ncbi:MAG TPA: ribosome maturation factor RimM [Sulfuricella sp.]|nr:ribosome maturation factor RimM [Sulfuricella sp.]
MGRIAAPFGIRGWVKIQSFTEEFDGLLDYPVWHLGRGEQWRKVAVLESEVHSKGLVVRLEGCNDRDAAAALKGLEIAVPREALPETGEDEYYWSDLIGLEVVNVQGEVLGKVSELLETGANDVLVVKGEREHLLPFIAQVILKVDLKAGRINVDWGADY